MPSTASPAGTFDSVLQTVKQFVAGLKGDAQRQAIRLSIPDLGDPTWGDISPRVRVTMPILDECGRNLTFPSILHTYDQDILTFLFRLRTTIRSTNIATFVTFPAHLSTERPYFSTTSPAGALNNEVAIEHWHQKISLLTDGCLLFTSFGGAC